MGTALPAQPSRAARLLPRRGRPPRRVVGRIDITRELLTDVLDANLAQISVRQNDDMRTISAWAAVIAVPTLLAGIWGMNFVRCPSSTSGVATRSRWPRSSREAHTSSTGNLRCPALDLRPKDVSLRWWPPATSPTERGRVMAVEAHARPGERHGRARSTGETAARGEPVGEPTHADRWWTGPYRCGPRTPSHPHSNRLARYRHGRPGVLCKHGVVGVPSSCQTAAEPSAPAVTYGQQGRSAQVLVDGGSTPALPKQSGNEMVGPDAHLGALGVGASTGTGPVGVGVGQACR